MRRSLLFIGLVFLLFSSEIRSENNFNEKELQTSLRLVGHRLLQQDGDHSSRVLPIERDSNVYKISFEKELAILPDFLIVTVDSIMSLRRLVDAYVVEIRQCSTQEIVHSYSYNRTDSSGLMSCKGRGLEKGCYEILFTLKKEADFDQQNITKEAVNTTESPNSNLKLLLSALALILALVLFFYYRKKNQTSVAHLISLGKYHFDQRKSELILAEERIELSAKEADLLLLLYGSLNETMEREHILNQVWGDEGDYVGRTLDVFISKLRKKLEADPDIKIVNVRGVGYKLVL